MSTITPQQTQARPTVLVVDDDGATLSFCQTILTQAGYTVLAATESSEALRICKQHQGSIDILVTDLILTPPEFSFASNDNEFPHVHGHELAVRALRMRKDLHVLLLSEDIDKDLTGVGIRKDALPFLTKPFEQQNLLSALKQALQTPPPSIEFLFKEKSSGPKGADEWFD